MRARVPWVARAEPPTKGMPANGPHRPPSTGGHKRPGKRDWHRCRSNRRSSPHRSKASRGKRLSPAIGIWTPCPHSDTPTPVPATGGQRESTRARIASSPDQYTSARCDGLVSRSAAQRAGRSYRLDSRLWESRRGRAPAFPGGKRSEPSTGVSECPVTGNPGCTCERRLLADCGRRCRYSEMSASYWPIGRSRSAGGASLSTGYVLIQSSRRRSSICENSRVLCVTRITSNT